ncbi:hypothetical protein HMPREF2531_00797 [Bacteroides intestinalis]|uniref:Uncharacterized protein n=2 Tax=Bacteroides TaxID=816 RepID=A0A139LS44_9BACE|nr:hypothetical protein BACCELL_05673 [Bacteroides cellulosilyticus DSM 14838]KXT54264.1 hypothetical protein HMPREF2531_00797 [Bacteroides intestinalis]
MRNSAFFAYFYKRTFYFFDINMVTYKISPCKKKLLQGLIDLS